MMLNINSHESQQAYTFLHSKYYLMKSHVKLQPL